jgi:predicted DNA binding protein
MPSQGGKSLIPDASIDGMMKFLDARVRIQHSCPFCDFSKAFPEMEMSSWCNVDNEVMQIVALDEAQLREICAYARERLGARQVAGDAKAALLSTTNCLCGEFNSVATIADKCESWAVPPTIYFGGWETHRMISHSKADLKKFVNSVRKIGKIEVVSLRERDQLDMLSSLGVAPIHFFGGLTNKQLRAIVTAYENGLFELPARSKMDKVAKAEGLSRSTYGEHLRKAMLQIVENSYPVLTLSDKGPVRLRAAD